MKLDELLRWVDAAGWRLDLKDGAPILVKVNVREPPAAEMLDALRAQRAEVIEWLTPPLPRRAVSIDMGRDHAPHLAVLGHFQAENCLEAFRRVAEENPGVRVAGEWLREREFRREWVRFCWLPVHEVSAREVGAAT